MALTRIKSRLILDGTLVAADVHADYKDGTAATPSLRTLGTGAAQACAGDDARLSDDRVASGLRTATTVVDISGATAPTAGQVLTAIDDESAAWADLPESLDPADVIVGEVPTGDIDGVNDDFTLANTPVAGTLQVYVEGVRMKLTDDYTVSGAVITFVSGAIPETGDNLLVDYRK